jgi:hypothetical protein
MDFYLELNFYAASYFLWRIVKERRASHTDGISGVIVVSLLAHLIKNCFREELKRIFNE